MGLVHQKQVLPLGPLPEVPLQPHVGVEHVIVVADDAVAPVGDVQAELKGADLVLLCVSEDHLPGDGPLPVDDVVYRIVDPVKMSRRPGAGRRVAVRLLQDAELLLGRHRHRGEIEAPLPQDGEGLLRHRPGDGLGRQVKDLVPQALPHRLQGRIDHGQRLSDARRRLDVEVPPPGDGAVDRRRQLPLPLPVGVGEGQVADGLLPAEGVEVQVSGPFHILVDQPPKPLLQLLIGPLLPETADLLRLHIAVGHLDADGGELPVPAVKIGVAHGLGQMHRIRPLHVDQASVHPLDLVDGHPRRLREDPVRTPLHLEGELLLLDLAGELYLRLVSSSHLLLDLPVDAASRLHGVPIRLGRPAVVQVPGTEHKLHQVPHRYGDHFLLLAHQFASPPPGIRARAALLLRRL